LITFGVKADYWLIAARLEGTTGQDGTVAFLMPNSGLPGAEVIDDSDTMGIRGTDHAILRFTDVPVPASALRGAEGHAGFWDRLLFFVVRRPGVSIGIGVVAVALVSSASVAAIAAKQVTDDLGDGVQ
ncbi:acyl-CoA dehydrogenase, partial [Bacillus sp. S34]|nr:acyl-CoA dehydrogenase [Bacillus sp. S34]